MVEMHVTALDGAELRYGGNTWQLTGDVEVTQNGESIRIFARQSERVRGTTGVLKFTLTDGSTSLNPGNLEDLSVTLSVDGEDYHLVVDRDHDTSRFVLSSVRYD